MTIVSLGEMLWDVFPDGREALGGAPFNFAYHASRLGHRVLFVSAVGNDERGRRALAEAQRLGLDTSFIRTTPDAETGRVEVTLDDARQPSFRLHRPAAYDHPRLTGDDLARLAEAKPDWIAFGTLAFLAPAAAETLDSLLEAFPGARRFYDVNLRPGNWTRDLVARLLPLADAVKLNESEAEALGPPLLALAHRAQVVCITRAERGCTINGGDIPGYRVQVEDAVGAGDAFSAALLHGLGERWTSAAMADFANRVGALIASRPGGTPAWDLAEAQALADPH